MRRGLLSLALPAACMLSLAVAGGAWGMNLGYTTGHTLLTEPGEPSVVVYSKDDYSKRELEQVKSLKVEIAAPDGVQAITKFEGGPAVGLQLSENGGAFRAAGYENPGTIEAERGTIEVKASAKAGIALVDKPSKK